MLALVADDNIAFKLTPSGDSWTTAITKGNEYEFNERVWGTTMKRDLKPIEALSDAHFR